MQPEAKILVIDDDDAFRDSVQVLCESVGYEVSGFESAAAFLEASEQIEGAGCLVLDVRMPGMSGVELHQELIRRGLALPVIFITGHGDVPMAVAAMKRGAFDFLTKPFSHQELLERINRALRLQEEQSALQDQVQELRSRFDQLTPREREVMSLVVEGLANKVIANRLDVSQRTVEIHRAKVMEKMRADSLAQLVRMSIQLDTATGAHGAKNAH